MIGLSARQPAIVPGKQPRLRLHPAPVHAQRLQQRRAERDVPIATAFAALDVNQHRRLSMSRTCRCRISAFRMPVEYSTISIVRSVSVRAASISRVTSSTVRIVGSRRGHLRIRDVVEQVAPLQRLHEEEPERRDMELHRPRLQLPLAQQVRLIRRGDDPDSADLAAVEMLRELLDRVDVGPDRGLGVVAPLEFLQHRLSEMGHRNLLVTHTLPDRLERASRVASAAPAASFKRRSVDGAVAAAALDDDNPMNPLSYKLRPQA